MESVPVVETALRAGPIGVAALALVVVGYLYVKLNGLQEARLAEARSDAKAQMDVLKEIVPLTSKLVDAIGTLERLTARLEK